MTTLAQAKASRIDVVLGVCPDDARFLQYINEAQQGLLNRGLWKGTFARIRLCVTNGCIVWPRQVENVEAIRLHGAIGQVRNEWFQFISFEPHNNVQCCQQSTNQWWNCTVESNLFNNGTTPVFSEIRGVNKKVKFTLEFARDAGKRIFIQGIDQNGQVIRTQDDGITYDGEWVTLVSPDVTTTNYFTTITAVQKELTDGSVRAYSVDPDGIMASLAVWEPDETVPSYRKTNLAPLPRGRTCCALRTVEAMIKMAFIPARLDTDFLMIGNLKALKYECQAIMKEEADLIQEAQLYHLKAIQELQNELRTYGGRDNVGAMVAINGTAPMIRTQL